MRLVRIGVGVALLLAACGTQAREGGRLSRDCRREVIKTCGLTFSRDKIRECLMGKFNELSDGCRKEIAAKARGKTVPVPGQREIAYGSDPKQRLDFAVPAVHNLPLPLVVFVHGGGWSIGDKASGTGAKAAHFVGKGYAFASLNYRLVPNATVEQQAADIASAIAYLRAQAPGLAIYPNRIVLMGHSAGAHLAALVASDPTYLRAAGVPMSAVKGVVLLDGAGYDVARQMVDPGNKVEGMYEAAFGTDPKRQATLSPITHTAAPNATDWLILPVAARADSTAQSQDFAAALRTGGSRVTVTPVADSSHMKLNKDLGVDGDFATAQVDAFTKAVLR